MRTFIIALTFLFAASLTAGDKAKTISLSVSGMTCQSCASTVEKALKKVDGVKEVKVDLNSNSATVTLATAKPTAAGLIKAVSDAGFEATEKTVSKADAKKKLMNEGEKCGDGCCEGEEGGHAKPMKGKKTESKKS